jgi:hypothetical protein
VFSNILNQFLNDNQFLSFKSRYQNLKKSQNFRVNYYNTQYQYSELIRFRFLVLSYAQSPIIWVT